MLETGAPATAPARREAAVARGTESVMFSEFGRFVVTTALVCSGAAFGAAAGTPREAARAPVWDPPVTLSTADPYPLLGDAALADTGDMAAVWSVGGDIQLALRPAGGAWGTADTVVVDGEYPQVEYDGHGRLLLAWTEHHPGGPARVKVRALSPDTGWAAARVVAHRARGPMTVADLAVNRRGEAVLAWTWLRSGLVSRGSTTGAWTTRLVVRHAPGAPWMDVALGDGGLAALTWLRAEPREDDASDLTYLVARQRRGSWESPHVLQTLRDFGPPWPGPAGVTVDAEGHTTVAWQGRTDDGWQIRVLRARKAGAWGAPSTLAALREWGESAVRVVGNQRGDVLVSFLVPSLDERLKGSYRPHGDTWSPIADIAGSGSYICDWDTALGPTGRAVALWSRARGPGSWGRGVQVALMTRAGRWTEPVRLTRAETVDGHTRRVAMTDDDLVAVWTRRVGELDYTIVARTGTP